MAIYPPPIPPQTAAVSGLLTAPAAAAVVADTGQLAAGDYRLEIVLASAGTLAAGKGLTVEHRNAANGANINTLGGASAVESREITLSRITIAQNERIRVVVGAVLYAASETAQASIRAHKL